MVSSMPSVKGKRCPDVDNSWYLTHGRFSVMYRDVPRQLHGHDEVLSAMPQVHAGLTGGKRVHHL
jgi:hypothetical protein